MGEREKKSSEWPTDVFYAFCAPDLFLVATEYVQIRGKIISETVQDAGKKYKLLTDSMKNLHTN